MKKQVCCESNSWLKGGRALLATPLGLGLKTGLLRIQFLAEEGRAWLPTPLGLRRIPFY